MEPVLTRVYKERNLCDSPLQEGMKNLAGNKRKYFGKMADRISLACSETLFQLGFTGLHRL